MRGRKTGGRQAGTPNKATSTLLELVEVEAGAPLPVLLTRIGVRAMQGQDYPTAINALSKAAAYAYPRITAVDPPHDPVNLPAPQIILNPPVVRFIDPPPCSECGHDPAKNHIHITRTVIGGSDRSPIQ